MSADAPAVPGPAGFSCGWLGQRIVFADGALGRLPDEAQRLGASRVLLVASRHAGLADRIVGLLGDGLAGRWDEVRQHVPADLAAGLAERAADLRADLLVSVGGGSALGLAKIAARDTGLPVLAIPTTYAGSEMTPVWGITQGAVKRTGRDLKALPATVIYDPLLLATLPGDLAGCSGMNALAHCAEALYAAQADPLTSLGALEGARLIAGFLPAAVRSPDPLPAAHRAVLWASCLAGRSFGTAGGSLHHSVCHLLGGSAGLPHAQTHAVVLPQVLAFVGQAAGPELARLADAMGTDEAGLAGAVWDLGARVGAPRGLRELGLAQEALPELARALADRGPASPRPVDREAALHLLTQAWRGDRPEPAGRQSAAAGPMTAAELTATVTDRLRATPDPRLREIMTALVRHLHGLVTEVGLSQDEWLAAIRFLTATGQICSDTRQEFILLSDTLGVSMLVDLLAGPGAAGQAGPATESTVLGPFYAAGSPERPYGGSIIERPAGDPAWYTGRVTDTEGNPLGGAVIDVWQNADDMLYSVQSPDAPPGHLRGVFRTRPDGSYAFLGVRPTDYPIPDDGPVGGLLAATGRHPWRPAHIHLIVGAPGHRSVATHIFDAQSRYLDSDAVFAVKPSLVRQFERHEPGDRAQNDTAPAGVPPGAAWYSLCYDFVLEPLAGP
ncbi:MAG TPA: maleylacetate reductase and hydroxyquinol 1,2-dioxygenase domain-containing protein [Streptosporangiaceae bacterium]|nr:maleylacetate reductase and hydroxyquinol 1,2-dioxygenase domain-containing protein [Streptosporangiaceae bacterium]